MSETMTVTKVQHIIEAALMAYEAPMTLAQLSNLFDESERPDSKTLKIAIENLQQACEDRGVELQQVASGYRYQAKQDFAPWLKKLWEERPPRYSRAMLETLALVAYRQPITRAEIEEVRGVAVSSNIVRTLMERGWVKEVGQRDVPGKPSLLGTTKEFLDYFNIKTLSELPSLQELANLDIAGSELETQMELLKQDQIQAIVDEDVAAADAIEMEIERHPIQMLEEDALEAEIVALEIKHETTAEETAEAESGEETVEAEDTEEETVEGEASAEEMLETETIAEDTVEVEATSEAEELAQQAAEAVAVVEQVVTEASQERQDEEE